MDSQEKKLDASAFGLLRVSGMDPKRFRQLTRNLARTPPATQPKAFAVTEYERNQCLTAGDELLARNAGGSAELEQLK